MLSSRKELLALAASRAVSDPSLLAARLAWFARARGVPHEELHARLGITRTQLHLLALSRVPEGRQAFDHLCRSFGLHPALLAEILGGQPPK